VVENGLLPIAVFKKDKADQMDKKRFHFLQQAVFLPQHSIKTIQIYFFNSQKLKHSTLQSFESGSLYSFTQLVKLIHPKKALGLLFIETQAIKQGL
jgi:hypothetical protein